MPTHTSSKSSVTSSRLAGLPSAGPSDLPVPTPVGLEVDERILIKPFCPPYYRSMKEAVLAFLDYKYAEGRGTFRDGGSTTGWLEGAAVQAAIPRYSEKAIDATIAYCRYLHKRYGHFPATTGPFRTVLAFQSHRLDPDFYARFYSSDAAEVGPKVAKVQISAK
jgi:hypothetical protein